MTNPAYEATNSDVEKLITSEIADFFAGIGQPGEPETPQEMQQQLQSRISAIFSAAPNGMMQLSNELAEMKRKCVELTVWYGAMPESNGKTNWTAILHRKGECLSTGITVDRSEYPDRVRYEADRMSHLIGELTEEPDILAYDANKHSGYTARKEGE